MRQRSQQDLLRGQPKIRGGTMKVMLIPHPKGQVAVGGVGSSPESHVNHSLGRGTGKLLVPLLLKGLPSKRGVGDHIRLGRKF